jgi:hypothetical protein
VFAFAFAFDSFVCRHAIPSNAIAAIVSGIKNYLIIISSFVFTVELYPASDMPARRTQRSRS